MKDLNADKRPIIQITELSTGEEAFSWKVGVRGVTEIIPYYENGHMAALPWLAVHQGEHVCARVPAQAFAILYAEAQ